MLKNKSMWLIALLSLTHLGTSSSMAMDGPPTFDLEGNGKRTPVKFSPPYFPSEPNDKFTFLFQGGYTVHPVTEDSNDVAVIGFLKPCIAIAVTDGNKLLTAHKHSANSLKKLIKTAKTQFDFTQPLYVGIASSRDDVEWARDNRTAMHNGKSHFEAVLDIRDHFESAGIPRSNISYSLTNVRDEKTGELVYDEEARGRYGSAHYCVAVRCNQVFVEKKHTKSIRFYSIDPCEADVFKYKGRMITHLEARGLTMADSAEIRKHPGYVEKHAQYDQLSTNKTIPLLNTIGYTAQRKIYTRRIELEEEERYLKHFGRPQGRVLTSKMVGTDLGTTYNTVEFYYIPNDERLVGGVAPKR